MSTGCDDVATGLLDPTDDGFFMVEAIVSVVVFAVGVVTVLALVLHAAQTAADNVRRTRASELMAAALDKARSLPPSQIPDGESSRWAVIQGVSYRLTQNAIYVDANDSGSVCSGTGSRLAYKLVTVTVSWQGMGNVPPVRGDTLKATGVDTSAPNQSTTGSLAVSVKATAGTPREGIQVTLSPLAGTQPLTTGADGCALFTGLAPGVYSVTAHAAGYTDRTGNASPTVSHVDVSAGSISHASFTYDYARSLSVWLNAPTSAWGPGSAGLAVHVSSGSMPDQTYPLCTTQWNAACPGGAYAGVLGLSPATYTVSVGACFAADQSHSYAMAALPVTADTAQVFVPVGTLSVQVVDQQGAPVSGRSVTATRQDTCADSYSLPATTSSGTIQALPYGTWTLSTPRSPSDPTPVTQTVTLDATTRTAALQLQVTS